jgi:hypothetical protein
MIIATGMKYVQPPFLIEEVDDPAGAAQFDAQMQRLKRNREWLFAHWHELLPSASGKFVVVAGQEPFVAENSLEAWAMARAAHPEDDGALSQYLRPERGWRIYANCGRVAQVS